MTHNPLTTPAVPVKRMPYNATSVAVGFPLIIAAYVLMDGGFLWTGWAVNTLAIGALLFLKDAPSAQMDL